MKKHTAPKSDDKQVTATQAEMPKQVNAKGVSIKSGLKAAYGGGGY
ncbi:MULTISPECIES: hypothetical protein [Pseudoalteromonas]|nr:MULTISPECIES: hypothetical protein [Pseudoalteromonas]